MFHGLVDFGVAGQLGAEARVLVAARQVAEDQQPGDFHEVGALFELFDRYAAVTQDAALAVDVGDVALAAAGVAVARVQGDQPALVAQPANVDRALAFAALHNGQIVVMVADHQGRFVGHYCNSSIPAGKGARPPGAATART